LRDRADEGSAGEFSRYGLIAFWHSMGSTSAIARNVEDRRGGVLKVEGGKRSELIRPSTTAPVEDTTHEIEKSPL